jgi:hypothetical protein
MRENGRVIPSLPLTLAMMTSHRDDPAAALLSPGSRFGQMLSTVICNVLHRGNFRDFYIRLPRVPLNSTDPSVEALFVALKRPVEQVLDCYDPATKRPRFGPLPAQLP